MHLVQILLPLYDNTGKRFAKELYAQVREKIIERFDGLTIYTRAPADGFWQEDGKRTVHDDVIIYEVMVDDVDKQWWRDYRSVLEEKFAQQTLVIRAHQIALL